MELGRVILALLSLQQDRQEVSWNDGAADMARRMRPDLPSWQRLCRRASLAAKAEAIVSHDRILTGRRWLYCGMNSDQKIDL